jgi:hypothetical protein
VFGASRNVFFRGRDGALWYIYRLDLESGEIRKFRPESALNSPVISPDRRWIFSLVPDAGKTATTVLKAFSSDGGSPITVCSRCYLKWPRDQKALFLSFSGNGEDAGSTYIVRLAPGRALPELPANGIQSENDVKRLPVVAVVDRPSVFPGATSSVYAFARRTVHRNLYRISLPP